MSYPAYEPLDDAARRARDKGTRRPLDVIDPITLQGKAVPPREWLDESSGSWIPMRNVTMLGGDGGLGKTLIGQQLLTGCAATGTWLGLRVRRVRALAIFAEDESDELWRRQEAINRHLGIDFADLEDVQWIPRVGRDSALAYFDQSGRCEPTDFLGDVMNQALGFGAQLIMVDSLHDAFAGNENIRGHARGFIGLLRQLAMEANAAVLLTAHPSLAGRNSGSGEAGSTSWHNSVRARVYLRKPDDAGPDERVLSRKKSNYGPGDAEIQLRWQDGVFMSEERDGGMVAVLNRRRAEAAFLACLDGIGKEGRDVSASPQASNYGPKVFVHRKERDGRKVGDLEAAMEELFQAGKIKVEEFGRPGDRRRRIVRCNGSSQGEADA